MQNVRIDENRYSLLFNNNIKTQSYIEFASIISFNDDQEHIINNILLLKFIQINIL